MPSPPAQDTPAASVRVLFEHFKSFDDVERNQLAIQWVQLDV